MDKHVVILHRDHRLDDRPLVVGPVSSFEDAQRLKAKIEQKHTGLYTKIEVAEFMSPDTISL